MKFPVSGDASNLEPDEMTPAYTRVKKGKAAPFGRTNVASGAGKGSGAAMAFLKGLGGR